MDRRATGGVDSRVAGMTAVALALAAITGCYVGLPDGAAASGGAGADGDGGGLESGGESGEPVDPRMYYTCDDEQRQQRGLTFAQMRRLSSTELRNTLTSLLGAELVADPEIDGRLAALPVDATVLAGDFAIDPPVGLALALSGVAKRAAEVGLADPQWVQQQLPACVGAGQLDEACAAAVATELGAKIWRRDLRDDEVADYVAWFVESGGGSQGMGYLLRRLLQAPSLVFHLEYGTEETDGDRVHLTQFEVASRVSYFAIDDMPDEGLFAAARAGELDGVDAIEQHVRRLMGQQLAGPKVHDFFRYYAKLTSVADPLPEVAALGGIADVEGLGAQMQAEAYEFFEHLVWREDDFATLMGSTAAFPRSDTLAQVFGTEVASGDTPVDAAQHRGLLHRPAMLASAGARTSPILRGAHIRKLLLCDELGLPDPAAVMARQDELGDLDQLSNRDKVTLLTDAGACAGCHGVINGLGFAFEGYDQVGMPRTTEQLLDPDGNVQNSWPIDTHVEEPRIEEGGPEAIDGSGAFVDAMVDSYKARACFSRRVLEYYRMRRVDAKADGCALLTMEQRSHDDSLLEVFVAAIANDDIFWKHVP